MMPKLQRKVSCMDPESLIRELVPRTLYYYYYFNLLTEHNNITFKWVRGHQGHEGDEREDFLANKKGLRSLIGPEPTCGLLYRTTADVHWRTIRG
ncbi:hypothetical protein NQ318_017952 [Aromia moschata]|uniref:RNase H type-1 domain-containing protein n=1 Tax=Aromia moschata TaxID=1265417 RepID=A0AAV8Y4N6_9CUCU|nr:hypothetical protein NQ318_017952 [Aromia moschata]